MAHSHQSVAWRCVEVTLRQVCDARGRPNESGVRGEACLGPGLVTVALSDSQDGGHPLTSDGYFTLHSAAREASNAKHRPTRTRLILQLVCILFAVRLHGGESPPLKYLLLIDVIV